MGDSSLLDLAVSDNQADGTSVPDGIRNNLYSRPNVLDLAASSTGSRQNFIDFSPKTGVAPRLVPDSPTPSVPLRNRSRKTSANRTEKLKYDEALSEPATPVGDPGENPSHTDPLKSMYRRMSSVSKLTKGLARRPTLQKSGSLDNVTDPTTTETKP
uniref:Uncharacterized protein n=1 Tax=Ciona savignyi TaxID=51511 RepID=H2Y8U3_CIOSA